MLLAFHVIFAVVLIIVVLLQAGKSGGFGTSFGGSSQTLFGATGAGNFLTKATTVMAVMFFVTSIMLTILTTMEVTDSELRRALVPTPEETVAPAPDAAPSEDE